MAITGKFWSAILIRRPATIFPLTYTTELHYSSGQQTLNDIATYYPELTWDFALEVSTSYLRSHYLPQCSAEDDAAPYHDEETAQTDLQAYLEDPTPPSGFFYDDGQILVRFYSGAWVNEDPYSGAALAGAPSYVAAHYPDANTYNMNSDTPFGDYGNGLIRHQALYHYPNGSAENDEDPIPGVYDDSRETDTVGALDISVVDRTFIWTPVRSGGDDGGVVPPDGVGDGVTDDDVTIRCWTYSLDGHDYYVLRVGQLSTLVYDLTTGTWSEWHSPSRTNWRAHIGCNWVGMAADTIGLGFGSDVVAGDDASGVLWILDPTSGRDDRTTTDSDPFTRIVTGGIQLSGRDVLPCGAVTLELAVGDPSQAGAFITLDTSDDLGRSWQSHGGNTITADDYSMTVEWRSLGTAKAPGRIFRLTDNGATVRISGCDLR